MKCGAETPHSESVADVCYLAINIRIAPRLGSPTGSRSEVN
jgi:hypothetical protein